MPLNWNIEKVQNRQDMTEQDDVVLNSLIWATISVGINEITPKNVDEFYARLHLYEKLRGTWTLVDGKPNYIKPDDLKKFIGLSTNAGSLTRTKFNSQVLKHYYADYIKEK